MDAKTLLLVGLGGVLVLYLITIVRGGLVTPTPLQTAIGFVLDFFRRLQQLRDAAESLVVEQEAERVEAELPVTDVLVPVDARSKTSLRIVQMKQANVPDADVPLEFLHR